MSARSPPAVYWPGIQSGWMMTWSAMLNPPESGKARVKGLLVPSKQWAAVIIHSGLMSVAEQMLVPIWRRATDENWDSAPRLR